MLADGLFERFPCDAVYGMHNGPGMAAGTFALRKGPLLATASAWKVTFHGTGGHGGATPHLATDITIPMAHYVLALQTIVGRNVPPIEAAVISVGAIAGGSMQSINVMPSELSVGGTARCFNKAVRDVLDRRMEQLAHSLAAAHGCTAEFTIRWGSPPLVNHPEQTDIAAAAAAAVVGAGDVDANTPPITGGEDFASMLEARPGAFIFIGNGLNPDGSHHPVHTPKYDFNDAIIPLGAAYWVNLVQQELAVTAA